MFERPELELCGSNKKYGMTQGHCEGALNLVLIVFMCTFGQVQLEIPQAKVGLVVGKGAPVKTIWSF